MISLKSLVATGLTLIAPPPNADPRLAPWFKSLEVPGTEHHGLGCCDIADCRNLPVRTDSEHYLVFYSDRWLVVAPEAVSDRTDNPTGDYISCIQREHWTNGLQDGPVVRCLIRPPRM